METSASPRESTRRKATGMTRSQVAQAAETARQHQRLRTWSCGSVADQVLVRGLEQAHDEWLRISCVMAAEKLERYHPSLDPGVRSPAADNGPIRAKHAVGAAPERNVGDSLGELSHALEYLLTSLLSNVTALEHSSAPGMVTSPPAAAGN